MFPEQGGAALAHRSAKLGLFVRQIRSDRTRKGGGAARTVKAV
jgi:hypothetical protein